MLPLDTGLKWHLMPVCATLIDWDFWIEYHLFETDFLDVTSLDLSIM